jgi:phosphatidylserine/phosphatidylglycerophosphate/cardiolipin synthase-like enzyme
MNWSASGDSANDENTLIIHDGQTAASFVSAFQVLYDALSESTLCQPSAHQMFIPLLMGAK